jgi:subtilisin family serine protease
MKKLSVLKKLILVVSISLPNFLFAQSAKPNWQNLDLKTDSVYGISTEKAYKELLKNKKPTRVLVAVIDAGVDIDHEDLKAIAWTNPKEIAVNKKDDDKNGYTDDVHGWGFLGSAKGNVQYDNLEITRLVRQNKAKFTAMDTTALTGQNKTDFDEYRKLRTELGDLTQKAQVSYDRMAGIDKNLSTFLVAIKNQNPDLNTIKNYEAKNADEANIKRILVNNMADFKSIAEFREQAIVPSLDRYKEQLEYHYNLSFDPRSIIGDNYTNSNERFYGNNDVNGPDSDHGTHVAGIIGAIRTNALGIVGVADDVRIMSVRTVPNGDERDKDVANAIRYAAANGAKVINMSFGKAYSYNKKVVDDAVKFAMSKDVLIVHAAGNDNKNTDVEFNFPTRKYEDKTGEAKAWLEIGASGPKDDKTLKASFSNYGKTAVDVFAPGVTIYSTTPGSKYADHSGTSMAAPVVAGLAALIRSYYPKLTALQVKDIIMKSSIKIDHDITLKDGTVERSVPFSELCVSGGVVNAYNALKLAATYK